MDLVSVHPIFNLYNRHWPILSHLPPLPPAKFVEGGIAHESMVGAGSIVAGAHVRNSVLSLRRQDPRGRLRRGRGDHAGRARSAAARSCAARSSTRTCMVPDGAQIGVDLESDRERYTVSDGGIIVVGKGQKVEIG